MPWRAGIEIFWKTASAYRGPKPPKEMIDLLECQIQPGDGMGEVMRGGRIHQIRTTLKAKIEKERRKPVQRMEGYSNDEETISFDFGMDAEVHGSVANGGLGDAGRGHGRRRAQRVQVANLWLLDDVALL